MASALKVAAPVYLFISIIAASFIVTNCDEETGYYWRDFTGTIPTDAVPGGHNKMEKITYIGQTIHTNGALIPGQIDPKDKKLYYHYLAVSYAASRNVKILCSRVPEYFEWISTDMEGTRFLSQKHLVPGGTDANYPLLIGRAPIDGEVIVGKVTIYYKYEGFAYAVSGKQGHQFTYELLTYNPKCTYHIDTRMGNITTIQYKIY